jgi:hypothetical protein
VFDKFTFAAFMEQRPLTANNLSDNVEIPPFQGVRILIPRIWFTVYKKQKY